MQPIEHLERLLRDDSRFVPMRGAILDAYQALYSCFARGGKLLLCGNGGSACDCQHIAGELMKGFLLKRPLTDAEASLFAPYGAEGGILAQKLQRALPCIVLSDLAGLSTAFANDVDASCAYAQQAFAFAKEGDVLLGISTSGNAKNVYTAAVAAKAKGAYILAMTGEGGGKLAEIADRLLAVPERETYRVQEMHLPLYHALCAMLESAFFGDV